MDFCIILKTTSEYAEKKPFFLFRVFAFRLCSFAFKYFWYSICFKKGTRHTLWIQKV